MTSISSIRDQSCSNPKCFFYDKTLAGNVIVHCKSYPRFKCKKCGKTWVSARHNGYYRLRSNAEKIQKALDLITKGLSIRAIAREVHIAPGTVVSWKKKFNS